jgi:hypothetical protein
VRFNRPASGEDTTAKVAGYVLELLTIDRRRLELEHTQQLDNADHARRWTRGIAVTAASQFCTDAAETVAAAEILADWIGQPEEARP